MKRHQLHVRITAAEYKFLAELSDSLEESIATLVRRMIRATMQSRDRLRINGSANEGSSLIQRVQRETAQRD